MILLTPPGLEKRLSEALKEQIENKCASKDLQPLFQSIAEQLKPFRPLDDADYSGSKTTASRTDDAGTDNKSSAPSSRDKVPSRRTRDLTRFLQPYADQQRDSESSDMTHVYEDIAASLLQRGHNPRYLQTSNVKSFYTKLLKKRKPQSTASSLLPLSSTALASTPPPPTSFYLPMASDFSSLTRGSTQARQGEKSIAAAAAFSAQDQQVCAEDQQVCGRTNKSARRTNKSVPIRINQ
eukprot:g37393.t1